MDTSNIILVGPPGAGKGTQAIMLREKLDALYISTGDLFRSHLSNETDLGKEAQKYMSAGELVPDALTINMLSQELEKKADDHGFILDGFPRNVVQADALSELLDRKDLSIDVVLFFNVPNDELVRRLSTRYTCTVCQAPHNVDQTKSTPTSKCNLDRTKLAFVECEGELYQRSDDAPEAIKRRLDVYDEETKPILNYYEEQNLLTEINSVGSVEEVFTRVEGALQ
jgi:adenylate kinase